MDPMLVWGVGLLGAAVLLLVMEVFVPSGGVIAITSGVVAIAGVVCLFMMKESGMLWGSAGTLMMLIVFPSVFALWVKVVPNTPLGRRMMGTISEEEQAHRAEHERQEHDELEALIGLEGRALTPLRPVGSIEIDGQRMQALAEGVAIESGDRVRVTKVINAQIRVRPAT